MAVHYREYLNLPQGAVGRKRWASTESRQAHVCRLCADTHVVYQVPQRCMLHGPISPSVRRLCADTLTSASTCGSPIDSIQPHAVSRAALCDARYAGRPQLVLTALRRDLVDSLEHARHIVVDVQDPVARGPRQVLLLSANKASTMRPSALRQSGRAYEHSANAEHAAVSQHRLTAVSHAPPWQHATGRWAALWIC